MLSFQVLRFITDSHISHGPSGIPTGSVFKTHGKCNHFIAVPLAPPGHCKNLTGFSCSPWRKFLSPYHVLRGIAWLSSTLCPSSHLLYLLPIGILFQPHWHPSLPDMLHTISLCSMWGDTYVSAVEKSRWFESGRSGQRKNRPKRASTKMWQLKEMR
jgi:hypothetical protein